MTLFRRNPVRSSFGSAARSTGRKAAWLVGLAMLSGAYASHGGRQYDRNMDASRGDTWMTLMNDPRTPEEKCTASERAGALAENFWRGATAFTAPVREYLGPWSDRQYPSSILIDEPPGWSEAFMSALGDFSALPFNAAGRLHGTQTAFENYCTNPPLPMTEEPIPFEDVPDDGAPWDPFNLRPRGYNI